jgi:protease IV
MKEGTLAKIIILLCIFSVFIGLVNPNKIAANKGTNNDTENPSKFQGLFKNKVALITLEGAISASSGSSDFISKANSAPGVLKSIKKATEDKTVKAVVLRINSPGGTPAMSQEVFNSVLMLRKKKPVVISMADVAASGAYYIAAGGDRIFADASTITGSVGVIMHSFNVQDLLIQKLGVKSNVIKSGKFKDMGSPYRDTTMDERKMLQGIINETYNQFVSDITKGRINRKDNYPILKTGLTSSNLKKYSDGRIMTGNTAKTLGFIDEIGDGYDAQQAAKKMAKYKFKLLSGDISVVPYNASSGISDMILSLSEKAFSYESLLAKTLPMGIKHPNLPLFMWE